ncbi:hypothetical protein [Okeania sp. SIO2C2]|nr:hypothetical protein [Okeania sp. SIO2C2]
MCNFTESLIYQELYQIRLNSYRLLKSLGIRSQESGARRRKNHKD